MRPARLAWRNAGAAAQQCMEDAGSATDADALILDAAMDHLMAAYRLLGSIPGIRERPRERRTAYLPKGRTIIDRMLIEARREAEA